MGDRDHCYKTETGREQLHEPVTRKRRRDPAKAADSRPDSLEQILETTFQRIEEKLLATYERDVDHMVEQRWQRLELRVEQRIQQRLEDQFRQRLPQKFVSIEMQAMMASCSQLSAKNVDLPETTSGNDYVEGNPPEAGKTFRIQGVPIEWDVERLQSFLTDQDASLALAIESLSHEVHGRSKTGTCSCQVASSPFGRPTKKVWRISEPKSPEAQPARPQYLVLDDGFLGMTTLYSPTKENHRIDVVAISGLGGHAFGSFKERGGDHMWLRDSLPYDLTADATSQPIARVMIYGYESTVAQSKNMQNLEDLATSFHSSLLPLIRGRTSRPIVFIAHSLGGSIVKQTLISLAKSENADDKKLIKTVCGIVFFGVPHNGMDIESLIPMVGNGPNRFLLESIGRVNSQILCSHRREFISALGSKGDSEVICFFETLESPTAQQDESGKWTMTGPTTVLVTKSSATLCRPWEDGPEHVCAIARTHSDLVKFGPHDHEYNKVCERLIRLVRRVLPTRNSLPRSAQSAETSEHSG